MIVDVDTNNGLIPVSHRGTTVVLEDGMQVTFSIDPAMPIAAIPAAGVLVLRGARRGRVDRESHQGAAARHPAPLRLARRS